MIKLTHSDLIKVGTLLGYSSLNDGLCQGFSSMWAQALLAQDEECFFNRLKLIASYNPDFAALITDCEEAKKKARQLSQLTQKEQDLLEIVAFFDGIRIYLRPHEHLDLFDRGYLNQDDLNTIYPFIQSKKLEGSELSILFNKSHIFSKGSLTAFLQDLAEQLKKAESELPILLDNAGHSVCLKYSKTKQKWFYIDTNDFSRYPDTTTYFRELETTELVSSLFESLSDSSAANVLFNMKVLSSTNQTELALIKTSLAKLALNYPITPELVTTYDSRELGLFFLACHKGDLNLIQTLLKHPKIEINRANRNGATPFYIACQNGHLAIVAKVLKHPGILINKRGSDETTPLYIACQNGHLDIVAKVLKHPDLLINQAKSNGAVPLHIACQKGYLAIVAKVLKHPAILINQGMSNGTTALHIACQMGHLDVVAELLKHPKLLVNQAKNNGVTALYIACQNNHLSVVELLLNTPGIDINSAGLANHTPLLAACLSPHTRNNEALFQLLLNKEASLCHKNNRGQTALDIAIEQNNTAALLVLLKFIHLHSMSPIALMSSISLEKALRWSKTQCPEVAEYLATAQFRGRAIKFFEALPLTNRVPPNNETGLSQYLNGFFGQTLCPNNLKHTMGSLSLIATGVTSITIAALVVFPLSLPLGASLLAAGLVLLLAGTAWLFAHCLKQNPAEIRENETNSREATQAGSLSI